ncbi:MAG: DJ-1/PfpI family protein [Thermoproteus sp. AZ2]|jgi:protease I|uniref:DJ-1/PfpI family protein n=1 Tax=Thermoproteus sp. AZ2 TaxID=1609232 RepID=A0ACC6UZ43_9CREN
MRKAKILIVAGDAVEAQEIFYPYYRLKEEGWDVDVAAPTKKPLRTVVHDFEQGWETYSEKPGYFFPWVTKSLSEVKPEEYDGLVIPGGRMPEYVRVVAADDVKRIVRHFFEAGKPVAAICHAPQILAAAGVIKGRRMTSYIAVRPEVENNGGIWVDQEVVIDGNLVTSRAWPDNPAWMREFIKLVKARLGQ